MVSLAVFAALLPRAGFASQRRNGSNDVTTTAAVPTQRVVRERRRLDERRGGCCQLATRHSFPPMVFLTPPSSRPPQGSPASQRNPGTTDKTFVGRGRGSPPGMCRSMSLPVVTAAAMHNLFVCTHYFLALLRILCPDSGRAHQCSTCVYSAAVFCAERISSWEACFLAVLRSRQQ